MNLFHWKGIPDMTTIRLRGAEVDYRPSGDPDDRSYAARSAEIDIVLPAANTSFSYRITDYDADGLPFISIRGQITEMRFNGALRSELPPSAFQLASVTWAEGTSIILSLQVRTGEGRTTDFFTSISGPALPPIRTLSDWKAFEQSVTDARPASGAFGPGSDIRFNGASDRLVTQDDEFTGTPGADRIFGRVGDDYFISSAGDDAYFGGPGLDQVSFHRDPAGIEADLKTGMARDGFGNTDQLVSIEILRGSAHDDVLRGDAAHNRLRGLEGNDLIDGRGGRDLVRYDRDVTYGGDRGVTVDLSRGFARDGFGDRDRLLNIEDVLGSRFNDRLTGHNRANELDGDAGNDALFGLGGRDKLIGGRGADRLDGGAGNDTLQGDQGRDTFLFRGAFGRDRILDFDTDGDRIDLSGVASITSFRDMTRNHLTVSGDNLLIADGRGNTVLLLGVERADLSADDFLF